jgi:cell division protein ZapA
MEFSISVIIADRPYRLKVTEAQEERVRKAAKSINTTMKELSGAYHYRDKQDLLAMAALQAAVERTEQDGNTLGERHDALKIIGHLERILSENA